MVAYRDAVGLVSLGKRLGIIIRCLPISEPLRNQNGTSSGDRFEG